MEQKKKIGFILGAILIVSVISVYALMGNKNGSSLFRGAGINFLRTTSPICIKSSEGCQPVVTTKPFIITSCTDSEGGKNYNVKGTIRFCLNDGSCMNVPDTCSSVTTLMEWFCNGNAFGKVEYICPNGCQDGACKPFPISTIKPVSGCSWCGNQCVLSSTLVGKYCADVMPPTGATCSMVNGQCTIVNGGTSY